MPEAAVSPEEVKHEGEEAKEDPVVEEGDGEVLQKDEVVLNEKPRRVNTKVIAPISVALLVMLVGLVLANQKPAQKVHWNAPFLPLEDPDLQRYEDDFNTAVNQMKEAWQVSRPEVREVFAKNFLPPSANIADDPLKALWDHVENMSLSEVPFPANLLARKDHSLHLKLLTAICRSVVVRLEQVEEMLQQNEKFGVPVAIAGHDKPYSFPSIEDLEGDIKSGMKAKEFLDLAEVQPSMSDEEMNKLPMVDKELAEKLLHLFDVEHQRINANDKVRLEFGRFFSGFESNPIFLSSDKLDYAVPYSKEIFRSFTLGKLLDEMRTRDTSLSSADFDVEVRKAANNWSSKVALDAAKTRQQLYFAAWDERTFLKEKMLQKQLSKGVRDDDLLLYCLFLL